MNNLENELTERVNEEFVDERGFYIGQSESENKKVEFLKWPGQSTLEENIFQIGTCGEGAKMSGNQIIKNSLKDEDYLY